MAQSTIEWTEMTWNPTTGCSKISQGCKFCYAEVMTRRLTAMGLDKYKDGFEVRTHPKTLMDPYEWKKPRIVFVNSMSDLFHEEVPLSYIQQVFEVMKNCPQHIFQILTKRAERLFELSKSLEWTSNVWMGVSVESQAVLDRVGYLKLTDARIKFLSCEPLLEGLPDLDLMGIDWVIVGGESGKKFRPMHEEWAIDIRDKCKALAVPFFFKQWGGANKKKTGRLLEGKIYNDMPKYDKAILV